MPFGLRSHPSPIKKAAYYVCFIGAKESPVIRDHQDGHEFVYPAMQFLLRNLVEAGPLASAPRITLQVSEKGLKIVQNVPRTTHKGHAIGKSETLKHFIPQHSITCAFQGPPPFDDLVGTILLIYNPTTRCPVHIHVYRCDSRETAALLTNQLQRISSRPENQMKFYEIEGRLSARGLLPQFHHSPLPGNQSQTTPSSARSSIPTSKSQSMSTRSDGGSSSSGRGSHSPDTPKIDLQARHHSVKSLEPSGTVRRNMEQLTSELHLKLSARNSAEASVVLADEMDSLNDEPHMASAPDKATNSKDGGRRRGSNLTPSPTKPSSQKQHHHANTSDDEDDFSWDREGNAGFSRPSRVEDFDVRGYKDKLKVYSSLHDVFGERPIEKHARPTAASAAAKDDAIPSKKPFKSDANAAYRPRPYYFHMDAEGIARSPEPPIVELKPPALVGERPPSRIERELAMYRELLGPNEQPHVAEMIKPERRHARPALPLGDQRPIVQERVRPSSFFERIRLDERDVSDDKFISPELFYLQYRS